MELHFGSFPPVRLDPVAPASRCYAFDPSRMFPLGHVVVLPPQAQEQHSLAPGDRARLAELGAMLASEQSDHGRRAAHRLLGRHMLLGAALLRAIDCASTRAVVFEDVLPQAVLEAEVAAAARKGKRPSKRGGVVPVAPFVPPPFVFHVLSVNDSAEHQRRNILIPSSASPAAAAHLNQGWCFSRALRELSTQGVDLSSALVGWSKAQLEARREAVRRWFERQSIADASPATRKKAPAKPAKKLAPQPKRRARRGHSSSSSDDDASSSSSSSSSADGDGEDDDPFAPAAARSGTKRQKNAALKEQRPDSSSRTPQWVELSRLQRMITVRRVWSDDMQHFTVETTCKIAGYKIDDKTGAVDWSRLFWRDEGDLLRINRCNLEAVTN